MKPSLTPPSQIACVWLTVSLAAAYFITGKLGLMLAFVHPSATTLWPPTGITMAAFLTLGYRMWPGIFIGAFLVNAMTAGSIATSFGIATGNTLEGLAGAYLVNRFANSGRHFFAQPWDIFKFAVLAAMLSTMVSATFGVTSLCLGGFATWANYGSIWLAWWLGNAVGALTVAPLLVLWITNPRVQWSRAQILEAAILLLSLFLIGQTVFGGLFLSENKNYPLEYLCVPILLWAAIRFGPRETATAIFLLSGTAIWGTLGGFGPFAREDKQESLLLLQGFMGVMTLLALSLAAVVAQRKRGEEEMRKTNNELDFRVQQRTAALAKSIEILESEITARKRAQEALRHSEEYFRSLIEHASDIITIVNMDGTIRYESPSVERLLGYRPEELVGQLAFDFVHPDDRPQVVKTFNDAIQNPGSTRSAEFCFRHKNGSWHTLESIGKTILDDAGEASLVVNSRDITKRKQVETALRDSEMKFRTVVQSAIEGIILADSAGNIISWNRGAEVIFGYRSEEVLGKALVLLMPEPYRDRHRRALERQHATGDSKVIGKTIELHGLRKDGGEFPLELSLTTWKTEAGAVYGGIIRDLTERKRIETALVEERRLLAQRVEERTEALSVANAELARAARMKDEFLASMSHELRTPLNAILGLSEALQEQIYGDLNEKQLKALLSIEESGHHLLALINDILDLSKIEAGKLELEIGPVPVESVCQAGLRIIMQMAIRKQLKVSSTFDSAVMTVQADGRRLKQILMNLLSNAVKFTPEHGAVGLEVHGEAEQGWVHFTVWDTGIGIPQKDMDQLFQPFVQLNATLARPHAGTGLGLALVRRMVELHGGSIAVQSEPGAGSRFTVTLPWQESIKPIAKAKLEKPATSGKPVTLQAVTRENSSVATNGR
ncbi:MAG: PAS domain S-box protein [bacterium]